MIAASNINKNYLIQYFLHFLLIGYDDLKLSKWSTPPPPPLVNVYSAIALGQRISFLVPSFWVLLTKTVSVGWWAVVRTVTSRVSSHFIAVIGSAVKAVNWFFFSLRGFYWAFFIMFGRSFLFVLTVPTAKIFRSYKASMRLQLVKKLSNAINVFSGSCLDNFMTTLNPRPSYSVLWPLPE